VEIDSGDRELLEETAARLLESEYATDEEVARSARAVISNDEINLAQVADIVRVGRGVWSDQEWLEMNLSHLLF
jgi:hypothetical protein